MARAAWRAALAAGLLLLLTAGGAAQDVRLPRITPADVRWDTVRAALAASTSGWLFASARQGEETPDPIDLINQISGRVFPSIASSPVPVLLPLDVKNLQGQDADATDSFGRFGKPKFFLAGPAGYSAAYTVPLSAQRPSATPREADIHISGFAFLYELPERVGGEQKPVGGNLLVEFPGLRRIFFEGDMRYLFERHGVLYEVAVECFEGIRRSKRPPCSDAHELIVPFLNALQIAGGVPHTISLAPFDTARPEHRSEDFTYHPPGALISGSSRRGGEEDHTVYAPIRFPLADGPVQSYSQLFMDLGDCTADPDDSRTLRKNGVSFRCRPGKTLAPEEMPRGGQNNYPWRDSFCERRAYYVGQCPAGTGHQGQDLVPVGGCALSGRERGECTPTHRQIVAVHDGAVLRRPGQEGLIIAANAPGTHLRFRYLHMNPKAVDADGWFSGRSVRAGEIIGKVSNFNGRPGGTSYHLHVDMQVPTKDGWTLVNPYMTLVTAYENMIGGRGIEIQPGSPIATSGVIDAAVPPEYAAPATQLRKKRGARTKYKRTK